MLEEKREEKVFFFPRREIYARYPRATELHVRTYVYRGVYYSGGRTLSVRVVSSVPFPSPPRSLLAARRRKTKSRRGRRHKSLNPVQRIPGSFSLFPFHPVFLFLLSVGEGRSVSSKIAALLFLRVLLEEECRCSRRNFRGAELLLIGLGMRRSSCSIVRHGISLAVYRFFFGRRVEARFDPVRFRPEFFQLCKRDSLFLTVCLSRLPPVARFIVLDLSRAFRDREQD